jgi:hypothetical protein
VQLEDGQRVLCVPEDLEYLGRRGEPIELAQQPELPLDRRHEPVPEHLADVWDIAPHAFGLPRGTQRRPVSGGTHVERLLDYLRRWGPITQREAVYHLGDWRLASTAHKLRRRGHVVLVEYVQLPTRYGRKATVARYSLAPRAD